MAELKKMTVQALRDLARKALGRGHSRFKTKDELIAALQAAEKKVSGAADRAAAKVKEATGRAAKAAGKMVETAKGKRSARGNLQRAAKEREERKPAPAATRRKPSAPAQAPAPAAEKAAPPEPLEPDAEGYFVARVAGEGAVRDAPHPMTETAPRGGAAAPAPAPGRKGLRAEHAYDEELGELPWSYGDDAFVALPRDPKTLFLYWDHADETLRRVWEGLDGGRPQLWLFAQRADGGWDRIRTIEFALESRSYYIHDLDPGRTYRVEIHVVDRGGREKLLGQSSNEMGLPPVGASPIVDDRFMRLPWGEPLQKLLRRVREGGPFPEELRAQFARLSDWSRFGVGGGGSAGGIGAAGVAGRPASAPTSPTSPWGSSGGEGR